MDVSPVAQLLQHARQAAAAHQTAAESAHATAIAAEHNRPGKDQTGHGAAVNAEP